MAPSPRDLSGDIPRDDVDLLERLYDEARHLPEAERTAFLDEHCAGDPALRAELESLLTDATEAEAFMQALGRVGDAELPSGDVAERLNAALEGRYAIERRLGEGGMATVFLARDLRHERQVALKVLKPELAVVLGAERFVAEIRTTAALQHPHILPLHDSGEADGLLFFVTPYVEGESLRQRLEREKQLPVDDAVRIATEVADALDYAHRQGVIHRDVKPGNILLHEGRALVADFGIALAVGAAGGDRLTETGLSLGTPSYMSPEQATGEQHVGPATDIYALGCVLYEMLAGEPPYRGGTTQAILAKIITGAPDPITAQRRSVPPNVDAAARKALEKVPADRFPTARDFAESLADSGFRHGPTATAANTGSVAWKRLSLALGALALASMLTLLLSVLRPAPTLPGATFELRLPPELSIPVGPTHTVDVSPDGSSVVFVGRSSPEGLRLWLQPLNQLDPIPLSGTEDPADPRFSPDGEAVAFSTYGTVQILSLSEGSQRSVVQESALSRGLSWGPDGWLYFTRADGLGRVSARGGPPERLTETADGWHGWPDALPNGRGVLLTVFSSDTDDAVIAVLSLETGELRTLFPGTMARYARSEHIVYATSEGALRAVPFDEARMEIAGRHRPLIDGVEVRGSGAGLFSLSESGVLVYLPDLASGTRPVAVPPGLVELVWVSRTGDAVPVDSTWQFVHATGIALSPEGRRVAVSATVEGNTDIWIKELPDGLFRRLTFDLEPEWHPAWSPDGTLVTYVRGGEDPALWRRRADFTGEPELLFDGEPLLYQGSWSPDGRWMVGRTTTGGDIDMSARDIVALRPGGDTAVIPLIVNPGGREQDPRLSPDGRWLAFSSASAETGQLDVYVTPFPDVDGGRVKVSTDIGRSPLWANSGSELFFWDYRANLIVTAQVTTDPDFRVVRRQAVFSPGPELVLPAISNPWEISPDDRRFLMIRSVETQLRGADRRYVVVQNLHAELEQVGRE